MPPGHQPPSSTLPLSLLPGCGSLHSAHRKPQLLSEARCDPWPGRAGPCLPLTPPAPNPAQAVSPVGIPVAAQPPLQQRHPPVILSLSQAKLQECWVFSGAFFQPESGAPLTLGLGD